MSLRNALEDAERLAPMSVPELRYLQAAAERVLKRWPEVQAPQSSKEREALAQRLRDCVERNAWGDVRLSFVVTAASAVFDEERRARGDLARTREFLYAETGASTSETFLTGIMRAYLESYQPKASHTKALSAALQNARRKMSQASQLLLQEVPELLDAASGPKWLAARMYKMSDPYTELLRLGVRNPHSVGFMDLAHLSLTETAKPHLSDRDRIDWYIRWLRPPGKEEGRSRGAEAAIEALIDPWMGQTPDDALRSHLVETLIELYGDPRIKSGGVWGGIDARYIAVVHRWLTREDMRFFTGVVDATQKDAMWPPRRDFWLKLYDEGKIDAAWAALSARAFEYARQHLMRQDAKNAYSRVAYQRARQNTSLLIMKIGNKIMVDGCHSYRTHVFDVADPMAPKLFEEGYDCEEIKSASDWGRSGASKAHNSIPAWSRWVRDMINADVPFSQRSRPYMKVFRPRPPQPRNMRQPWDRRPQHPERSTARQQNAVSKSTHNQFFQEGAAQVPPSVVSSRMGDKSAGTPASIAASRRQQDQSQKKPTQNSGDGRGHKQAQAHNLTDRLIANGPSAAEAVLAYLATSPDSMTRRLLSQNSREALAWISKLKGRPPPHLRNVLEYVLLNLKRNGVDLDELFASTPLSKVTPQQSIDPDAVPEAPAKSLSEKFPPLPKSSGDRLEVMRAHANELDDLGMWQSTFQQRMASTIAISKLRQRSEDIQPEHIKELERLYEKLRNEKNRG